MLNQKEKQELSKEYEYRFEDYKTKKRNRKVLEKLKDKEFKKFLKEQDKEEQDFLDELSLNMYYKEFEEDRDNEY